jgi:DNA-binding winged helix-turn-helix (wHTH) protein
MQITFGSCRLDLDTRQLFREGQEVRLTPKAFELLTVLVTERPRAVSKAELTERVWKGTFVTEDGLPRLINEIRTAVGDAARDPRWIRTVHGFGYAFAAGAAGTAVAAPPAFGVCVLTWGSHEFRLTEGEHVLGRDASADIPLEATVISRRHARIVVAGARATVEDLGSKNGTFVGDRRISAPHELRDGDELRIGDFTLTFHAAVALPTETRP